MERESGRAVLLVSVLYLVGLLALWAWLGYSADSALVGIVGLISLILVHYAFTRASSEEFTSAFFWSWLGVLGMAGSATLAEWAGQWIWAIPWSISGLILIGIGLAGHGKAEGTSWSAYLLAAWSLALGIAGPAWLIGKTQDAVRSQVLDLLVRWWWVALIVLVALVVLIALGTVAIEALRDRRRRSARRPTRRPSISPPNLASPFENAIFGRNEPGGSSRATPPGTGPISPVPSARPPVSEAVRPAPQLSRPPSSLPSSQPVASAKGAGVIVSDPDLGRAPSGGDGATVLVPDATVLAVTPSGSAADATVLVAERGATLLYQAGTELLDLAAVNADHVLLTADGRVLHRSGDRIEEGPGLQHDRRKPIGLSVGGDVAVVAGEAGELVAVNVGGGVVRESSRHSLDSGIVSFAVNAYGSIVAWSSLWVAGSLTGPPPSASVQAVVLATSEVQPLIPDDGRHSTTAMAFSPDGRNLALGRDDGTVSVMDMATRRVEANLPAATPASPIVAMAASPTGGWVVAYGSRAVKGWDASGSLIGETAETGAISSLAVEPSTGRIAVARDDGHITVYSAALAGPGADHAIADARIVRVVFEAVGGPLLCASRDGAVWRLPL